jgi:hypothetical protein
MKKLILNYNRCFITFSSFNGFKWYKFVVKSKKRSQCIILFYKPKFKNINFRLKYLTH